MTLKITTDNIATTALSTLGGAKITSLAYAGVTTGANNTGGETLTITGSGFSAGTTVYVDTTSCATTYVSATSLTFTAPVKSTGSYHLYVYNTDGSFALKPLGITYISYSPSTVEYLVIAGGGGGGGGTTSPAGSGGGAGGYRTASGFAITPGTPITVTVGAGGTAGTGTSPIATKGNDSVFSTITSTGGGAGAYYLQTFNASIHSGGSGGGATWNSGTAGSGNTPSTTPSQGNNGGGIGSSGGQPSSGGGGAGGAGTAYGSGGGAGGAGSISSISGSSITYAGGGGGGAGISSNPGGTATGGGGGGGNSGVNGSAGSPNTGGGGGGAGETQGGTFTGGAGGSGVVIIRYPDTYPVASGSTGSPTVTNPTGYRVYTFTASGSITF